MTKPQAVICDLDNSLALLGDRDPMHGHLCATDTVCAATALVVFALAEATTVNMIFLTGRNETAREATAAWLVQNVMVGAVGGALIMRDPNDWRPAAEYKLAMLDERILPHYDVVLALDDDPAVCAAFRERGIVCFQVREGLDVRVKEVVT